MDYDEVVDALIGDSPEEESQREAERLRLDLREARAPDDPPGWGWARHGG